MNTDSSTLAQRLRRKRFWFLLVALILLLGWIFIPARREPAWQGKTLRQWMRGHPREYGPALQAMGTNAIPFLLSELQHKDSALARLGQEVFRRFLDSTPPWETASMRHYHARIAFQILDTNAVPALLHALFQEPFQVNEFHITWGAAFVCGCLVSSTAREQVRAALSKAMEAPDIHQRRNACLAFYAGFRAPEAEIQKLIELTREREPLVRAAATRTLIVQPINGAEVVSALAARLDDPQAAIRCLATQALAARKTNALAALPALLAAYTNELIRASLMDDVDDIFRGKAVLSPQQNQSAIRYAIQAIAPGTPVPGKP